jgi:hypothetical protein
MRFWVLILVLSIRLTCTLSAETDYSIKSPDNNISVFFGLTKTKQAFYRIEFSGIPILQESKLGIVREDAEFTSGLSLVSVSEVKSVSDEYILLGRKCSYNANQRIFYLKNASGAKLNVTFQVSNDGVAYRYFFPDSSKDIRKISAEISSFNFLPQTKTRIQPIAKSKSGWCQVNPSYEEHYQQDIEVEKLITNKTGWVFPALFQSDKYWMLLTETAPDRNYCGSRLQHDSTSGEFRIGFPQASENFPRGSVNPESTLPWYSPWRIICVGKDLKTIVESHLGTDLAEPNKLTDISFVKPGRASWSWPLLKDDSITYPVQKRFIDLSSDMKWEYCLIDVNWDTNIGYDKIHELADYAKEKNVGLILWYNSSGDWNTTTYHPKSKLLSHESRVQEFTRLKEMGIKGIKVDFFGGDGQSMMAYYQDILEDAAAFGLVVNCHGSTFPRGWQRTYPNLVSMEGVRGFEYITFEQYNADQEANHSCMLPFTRNVFDPMDFTPMCFSEVPNIKRITTNGFELALSIIFWSGIQHYAETPEGMAKVPEYVRTFLRGLPASWDETRFIDGFPGKFVVLARRSGNAWFVVGINGDGYEKQLHIQLPFVVKKSTVVLISDGNNNRTFEIHSITVIPSESIDVTLKANGGFVLPLNE